MCLVGCLGAELLAGWRAEDYELNHEQVELGIWRVQGSELRPGA